MKRTKFIVVKELGVETMVVFEDIFTHSLFANSLGREVVSAGFLAISNDTDGYQPCVSAYGDSVSLGVKSRGEVDRILACKLFELDIVPDPD